MNNADYAVGRGKPPVQTRFRKGQSGNPSGKPGPAKLLRSRFQRALYEALEMPVMDVALAPPQSAIAAVAKQLTLDAMGGRTAAQRLLLSLLDSEAADGRTRARTQAPACDVEEPFEDDECAGPPPAEESPAGNEAQPFSLVQGKKQGSGEKRVQQICELVAAEEASREAVAQARKRMRDIAGAPQTLVRVEPARAPPDSSTIASGTTPAGSHCQDGPAGHAARAPGFASKRQLLNSASLPPGMASSRLKSGVGPPPV